MKHKSEDYKIRTVLYDKKINQTKNILRKMPYIKYDFS